MGRVFAFGWGENGALGNGGHEDIFLPIELLGFSDILKVDAGGYKHALVQTSIQMLIVE